MKAQLAFVLAALIVTVSSLISVSLYYGYDATVYFLAKHTASLHRISEIKQLLTPTIYWDAIGFAAFYLLLTEIVLLKFNTIYPVIRRVAKSIGDSLMRRISHDWLGKIWILLVLPIGATIYYAWEMPISLDEAYTYTYFSSRSIFACISYYSAPNNHILYSILENLCLYLPLPDLICIRIPAIISGIGCTLFLYSFIKEYYNPTIATIAVAIFQVMTMSVYYSYMARGYSLECLFFILLTYSAFKIADHPQIKLYWLYFLVASVLGLYTIPSFLYPFIIANTAILIAMKRFSSYHLITLCSTIIITSLLYLPVVLVNGLDSLVNNNVVAPRDRFLIMHRQPHFWMDAYEAISGQPALWLLFLFCAVSIILFIRYKGMQQWYFALVIVISPILLIAHGVLPFFRTFEYFTVIIAIFFAILIYEIVRKWPKLMYSVPLLIILQLLCLYSTHKEIMVLESYSIEANRIVPKISDGRKFYVHSHAFDLYLNFYFRERRINNYDITLEQNLYSRSDVDTIPPGKYDYCILEHANDMTQNQRPILRNESYSIYKK